jgi:hypothetical protein
MAGSCHMSASIAACSCCTSDSSDSSSGLCTVHDCQYSHGCLLL